MEQPEIGATTIMNSSGVSHLSNTEKAEQLAARNRTRIIQYLLAYQIQATEIDTLVEKVMQQLQYHSLQTSNDIPLPLIIQTSQTVLNEWFSQYVSTELQQEQQTLLSIHLALLCWRRLDQYKQMIFDDNATPLAANIDPLPSVLAHAVPVPAPLEMPIRPFEFWSLSYFFRRWFRKTATPT